MKEKKALKIFIIILSCITVLTLCFMPMISAKADYAEAVGVGNSYNGGTVISCAEGSVINATFLSSEGTTLSTALNENTITIPDGNWMVNSCIYEETGNVYNFSFVLQEETEESIVVEPPLPIGDGEEPITQIDNDTSDNEAVTENNDSNISPMVTIGNANSNSERRMLRANNLLGAGASVSVTYHGLESGSIKKSYNDSSFTVASLNNFEDRQYFINGNWELYSWRCNGVTYQCGSTFENASGNYDFYALWKGNIKYKFDTNSSDNPKEVVYNDDYFLSDTEHYSKQNFTFIGWSDDPEVLNPDKINNNSSDDVKYNMGAKIAGSGLELDLNQCVTLYAVWQRNNITVKYEKGVNCLDAGSMPDRTAKADIPFNLDKCTFIPKKGYKFWGWSSDPNGIPTSTDEMEVQFNQNITLYAICGPITYDVTFHPNCDDVLQEDTFQATYDQNFVIPDFNITKEGYYLAGWGLSEDDSNFDILASTGENFVNLAFDEGVTVNLYAKWKPLEILNLSESDGKYIYTDTKCYVDKRMTLEYFYPNQTTASSDSEYIEKKKYYKVYTDHKNSHTGCTLLPYQKWYFTYDDASSKGSFTGIPIIEYDANGGSGIMPRTEGQKYSDNPTFRANVAECAFERKTGYYFKEWNTKADGTGDTYLPYDNTSLNANNYISTEVSLKLYAIWEPISYKIKFDSNLGEGVMPQMENLVYDNYYTLVGNLYTRNDYSFTGWALSPDSKVPDYKDLGRVKNLAINNDETVTLYAVWYPTYFNIIYDANGGKGDKMSNDVGQYNVSFNLADNKYTKYGSYFLGWSTDKKAKNAMYVNGALIKNPELDENGNFVLYAIWHNTLTPTPIPTVEEEEPVSKQSKSTPGKTGKNTIKDKIYSTTKVSVDDVKYNIMPTPVALDTSLIVPVKEDDTKEDDQKKLMLESSTELDLARQKVTLSQKDVLIDDQELFLRAVKKLVGKDEQAALSDIFGIDYYEKNKDGEWEYVKKTDKLYRITLDVPDSIKSNDADYCLLMKGQKDVIILVDLDDKPDTVTVAVSDFDTQYMMIGVNNLNVYIQNATTTFSKSGLVIDMNEIVQSDDKKDKSLLEKLRTILVTLGIAAEAFVLIYLFKTRLYPRIKKR